MKSLETKKKSNERSKKYQQMKAEWKQHCILWVITATDHNGSN